MRKPPIYLVVFFPIVIGGGLGLAIALITAYSRISGIALGDIPNRNALLIALPTLCLWIPAGFLLSNCVIYAIPPLRKVAERYTTEAGTPAFSEAQRQILSITGLFALICLPLIALGFLI